MDIYTSRPGLYRYAHARCILGEDAYWLWYGYWMVCMKRNDEDEGIKFWSGINVGNKPALAGVLGGGVVDTTAPTVAITSAQSGVSTATTIPATITFSEAVTGFVVGDLTIKLNGVAEVGVTSNFATVDNIVWTVDVTPSGAGTLTIDIAAAVCKDAAGNDNTAATQFSIIVVSLWVRAGDVSGNDGDAIATWTSREGNSYAFAGAATKQPLLKLGANGINNKAALLFDGSNDILVHVGALFSGTVGAVLAVIQFSASPKNSQDVFHSGDEGTAGLYTISLQAYNSGSNPNIRCYQNNNDTASDCYGSTALVAGTPYIMVWQSDGSLYIMDVNGTLQTVTVGAGANNGDWFGDTTLRDNVNIGGAKVSVETNFFKGLISEIMVLDGTIAAVNALRNILASFYSITVTDTMVAFGDSVTAGTGASDAAHRWANIVATTKSWQLVNSGLASTTLQNTTQNSVSTIGGAVDNNGRDTYISRVLQKAPQYVLVLYGLNDLRLNDVAFTVALFQNDLGEVVDALIAAGVAATQIVIGSPTYIPATSYGLGSPWDGATAQKYTDYIAACSAVATAKGTKYIDVYQWMADNGGDTLISGDNIHPNDAGHAAIANAFLSVL